MKSFCFSISPYPIVVLVIFRRKYVVINGQSRLPLGVSVAFKPVQNDASTLFTYNVQEYKSWRTMESRWWMLDTRIGMNVKQDARVAILV